MAAKARSAQEDLQKRMVELESRLAAIAPCENAVSAASDGTAPGLP
jgi:BMFP domain-containing protein YqiC